MGRKDFLARLALIAEVTGKVPSNELIAFYEKSLADLGYPALCTALEKLMIERNDRDPFPSVKTIRELIRPAANPEHDAIEAANRIVEAMERFGWPNPRDARAFIGELGWLVVEREGGWESVCEKGVYSKLPMLKAQWRELAKSLHGRAQRGDDSPPQLPASSGPGAIVHSLAERLSLKRGDE